MSLKRCCFFVCSFFNASNAFIRHTRLSVCCCCCFVVFVVVVVVVDYFDTFLSKLNDKHFAPATRIVCYTASRSISKDRQSLTKMTHS